MQVHAINVDKMVVVAIGDDEEKSRISVINPDDFPVLVSAELSEIIDDGSEVKFNDQDFKDWPVYLDENEWIIDPKSRVNITVNNLLKTLGSSINEDRVVGVSFIPQTYQEDDEKKNSLSILTGFKVWYIIPNNKKNVTGGVDVNKVKNNITLINKTDSIIKFYIDSCKSPVESKPECSDSILVLSGKEKKVTFDSNYSGEVSIHAKDFRNRYEKKFKVKL